MKINPRHRPVAEARRDLATVLEGWMARHSLTWAETLSLLHEAAGREIQGMVRIDWKRAEKKAEQGAGG